MGKLRDEAPSDGVGIKIDLVIIWCFLPAAAANAEFRQRVNSIQFRSIVQFHLIGFRALRIGFSSRTGKLSTLTPPTMPTSTSKRASLSNRHYYGLILILINLVSNFVIFHYIFTAFFLKCDLLGWKLNHVVFCTVSER